MEQFAHYANDPAVWVAIAFVIFIGIAAKLIFPKMGRSLDEYTIKIQNELHEAETLKKEAQKILASVKKKAAESERTAHEILERAKFEAKLIADEAEKDIDREIERKMKLAEEKIKRAEEAAVENVRKKAIDTAVNTAAEVLKKEFNSGKNSEKQVEKSIRLISGNIS